ncbi:MAG: NAD-dependent epimerase/dehydratase family protein [Burkholderiales bacterium]
MTRALVLGAGGFIGCHLVTRLKDEGLWVRGVDLKRPRYSESAADEFVVADLRDPRACEAVVDRAFDEVYQLAADMGGAGYVFTGVNDADILHNSALVNLNVLDACHRRGCGRVFYSSSACVYPVRSQCDPDNPDCAEARAYPAEPDSEYGWEKLFGERLYLAYARNKGLVTRIARYHNIFGPLGSWNDGREKAPAALCRKVAQAADGGEIEIWGDGRQTRSFLYIDECLEGTLRLMRSTCGEPLNIGSDERVSIDELARLIIAVSGKSLALRHVPGPRGVAGRNSDNRLVHERLGWRPIARLRDGIAPTYAWIESMVARDG